MVTLPYLKILVHLYIHLHPHPSLPPGGKEQNLSPLGEIRKGVKIIKNLTIIVAKILKFNIAIGT
jgi:hypothetical protein